MDDETVERQYPFRTERPRVGDIVRFDAEAIWRYWTFRLCEGKAEAVAFRAIPGDYVVVWVSDAADRSSHDARDGRYCSGYHVFAKSLWMGSYDARRSIGLDWYHGGDYLVRLDDVIVVGRMRQEFILVDRPPEVVIKRWGYESSGTG